MSDAARERRLTYKVARISSRIDARIGQFGGTQCAGPVAKRAQSVPKAKLKATHNIGWRQERERGRIDGAGPDDGAGAIEEAAVAKARRVYRIRSRAFLNKVFRPPS